jgi:hypothetical protein
MLLAALGSGWAGAGRAEIPPAGPGEHGTGLLPEDETSYRGFPAVARYRAFLPPEHDLSRWFPPPGAQGAQSSCVGWAVGYGMRSYYENRRQGYPESGGTVRLSPSFIYNQLKTGEDCQTGTRISDALTLLQTTGTVPLTEFPYDRQSCSRRPGPELVSEARQFRIADWSRVDTARLDDLKGQLFRGNPVVISFRINDTFHHLAGNQIYDDSGPDGDGHAMVVVGYSDPRGAFRLFNSWGTKWGDNGLGWVSYSAFQARTRAAFVARIDGAAPLAQTPAQTPPTQTPIPANTPKPRPEPRPEPVAPAVNAERLKAQLAGIPCSGLRVGRDGERTLVRGFVGRETDRERALELIAAEPGGAAVQAELAVLPWPQCEAHQTFAQALARPEGLSIRLVNAAGSPPVLGGGDSLELEIHTPSFPSHLYVVYIQAVGDTVFLMTPGSAGNALWPPGSRVTVGGGRNGQPRLIVDEPYGAEMILVLAADEPAFGSTLPASLTEREFLSLFRSTLLTGPVQKGGRPGTPHMAAASLRLTTRARR